MTGLQSYVLSKKYTEQSLNGIGALKGAPCTIKSTTETDEGTIVVFEWTGTDGSTETKAITIKKGVSITDIEINSNKHLICTMSDGSTIDAGEVPNIKGDTGFSPIIEENPNNTDEIYKLDITNESSTFTTPNLKGPSGGLDPDKYYNKTQVDAFIEPLDEAKHAHNNKETVLDKLTTNATGDTLLFKGQEISSVKIDDTTTTAADKVWSAKKINDTIDAIKAWVDSEESLAIKTALYNNNTLTFYKKPNATIDDTADFSINLPEEQFLDQAKTTFINNFVWSEELYPNSTNPNLDNQPVLVLGVKGDTNIVYSFVSMNELVKIYKASTTVSTVTLVIEDTTNTISAKVNISADEDNLLKVGTDGGLYAKVTVDNALSDTSENPVQNKAINIALNNKADLSDIPTELPANGGNADTVGNKGISQILAIKGWFDGDMDDLKEQGSYIANEATNMPISGGWGTALVFAGGTGSVVQVFTAYITSTSDLCKTYIRHFTGDLWSTWVNIADGGNADTLDDKHASDFTQIINLGNTSADTKSAIGIPYKTTIYWCAHWTDYPATLQDGQGEMIAIHYKGSGTTGTDNIWCRQIFISPHPNTKIYQRILSNANVGDWINIADGGNAATVNGYTVNANVPTGFSPIGQNTENKTYTYEETTYTGNNTSEVFNDYTNNMAAGTYSHAEGNQTKALESYAHSEGVNTVAIGRSSHAEGSNLEFSERYHTIIFEDPREVQINDTTTITVEGSQAFGLNSHAEGCSTLAYGKNSHTEGYHTVAKANESHAEGCGGEASGSFAHAEGFETKASSSSSHAEGYKTTASGAYSHAEGYYTTANGSDSHAEGLSTNAVQKIITDFSSATTSNDIITAWTDKKFSLANGKSSHTEGKDCLALGDYSHAEGDSTTASGINSHAEGSSTIASGTKSHAEGASTTASGGYSHTEGYHTVTSDNYSHAEGNGAKASSYASHAEGLNTTAGNYASHASGKYNAAMTTGGKVNNTVGTAFVIGNGTASNALSNAFSVQYSGIVKAKSTITASTTADYAEFFEWLDGNPDNEDRVGYFVTLDGDKIRIATAADDYILGVVSGEPFVLGNGDCDTWNGMYLHDEFRRTIYEPAPKMIEILDSEGNPTGEYEEVEGEFEGTRPKLNPEYDHTQPYISRLDRKEWAPVGMLGVLAVRHDGTAQVNGYVTVNADGIATACEKSAENAYRVIKSNTDSVVEIIFR